MTVLGSNFIISIKMYEYLNNLLTVIQLKQIKTTFKEGVIYVNNERHY